MNTAGAPADKGEGTEVQAVVETTADAPPVKAKPVDSIEKDQQPLDNDDDEKLADNHRKMAKIKLKKEEIQKLQDTHNELTQDAVKQAKAGASTKKVQHNLKIAKTVAKRVQDLEQ